MSAKPWKVLVSDKLAKEGLAVFEAAEGISVDVKVGLTPDELENIIGNYDALAIRSATQVDRRILTAARNLKIVGRAGIGVDNVDVPAASERGILVVNTPEGNVVTTAEHAISLMCALARRIPQATASMKQGKWEKNKFQGREMAGKVLGIIGLGNIGKIVANRAFGLKMEVIAYDPYITPERARELGVEAVELDALLTRADFVTLHVPMVEATKNIISKDAIRKMKPGAFLINAARGGLVDERAAAEALKEGHLAGAAFDVFVEEPPAKDNPLLGLDNVVLTPHLGASTEEAQVNVSVAVAEQIIEYLVKGVIKSAVNAPTVSADLMSTLGPYIRLGRKAGKMAAQIHQGGVREIRAIYAGDLAELPMGPVTAAMLAGVLETALACEVNPVSAPYMAKERGINVVEERTSLPTDFARAIVLKVHGGGSKTEIVGALFGEDERIVRVNGTHLEIVPEGAILLTRHFDRPGVIGRIGTILGEAGVNISRLNLSKREEDSGLAEAVVSIERPVTPEVLKAIEALDGIERVVQLNLD
ncbi:MAG: phosphoglycerate dehydrogenase [Deltaproteobacteria bacterium]|nr:phosphoglycerate dehydrogenase [Deltaproteobacteria bacterium]